MEGESFVTSIFGRIPSGIRFLCSVATICSVVLFCSRSAAQDSANEPVYPEIGPTTHFLDHDALIAGFAESEWYQCLSVR
jgi:hypothetical protein